VRNVSIKPDKSLAELSLQKVTAVYGDFSAFGNSIAEQSFRTGHRQNGFFWFIFNLPIHVKTKNQKQLLRIVRE